jgi:hypothetical protein
MTRSRQERPGNQGAGSTTVTRHRASNPTKRRGCLLLVIGTLLCSRVAAVEPGPDEAARVPASSRQDERLLLGFEPGEIDAFPAALKRSVADTTDVEGRPCVELQMPYGRQIRKWRLYKGNASQGEFSVGLNFARKPNVRQLDGFSLKPTEEFVNRDAVIHYFGMFTDHGSLFSTTGIHHVIASRDWSDYDLLRMDVYAEDLTLEYHVSFEDEEILPPIVRSMTAPPGKWITLEVDLRASEKARGVDLSKITSLSIGVTDVVAGTPKFADDPEKRRELSFARLDNVRLTRRHVEAKHPVIRDESPYVLLDGYYPPATEARPRTVTRDEPDRSPVVLREPIVVKPAGPVQPLSRFNFVAAYDNNHLLVGFNEKTFWGARVCQTLDGGKTWRGLEGETTPTPLRMMDFIDGGGRGEVIDRYGDVVIVTFSRFGCGGPTAYHPRVFTRKLTFDGPGKGWTTRELPALVDCEPRHCVAEQSTFRAGNGRIWLAYGSLGRLDRSSISLRYSDDDAISWRPVREGFTGKIPDSYGDFSHHESGAYSFTLYTKQDPAPRLVPFGKGLVCLWHNRRKAQGTDLQMVQFDGRDWLPVSTVPYRFNARSHYTPRLDAVSVNGREIFVLSTYADGVLHYQDGVWTQELTEVPAGLSRLCLAGDQTVMLIAAFPDRDKLVKKGYVQSAPVVFRAWQRAGDGRWSGPRRIASLEEPISIGGVVDWAGFRVPRFSPPNFVPLMWVGDDQWIRILRVPVEP